MKIRITVVSVHFQTDALNQEDNLSLDEMYPDGNPVHEFAATSEWALDPLDQLILKELQNEPY